MSPRFEWALPLSVGDYCQKCGRKLIEYRKRAGFDATTGERVYETGRRCPRRWFGHQNTPFPEFDYGPVERALLAIKGDE